MRATHVRPKQGFEIRRQLHERVRSVEAKSAEHLPGALRCHPQSVIAALPRERLALLVRAVTRSAGNHPSPTARPTLGWDETAGRCSRRRSASPPLQQPLEEPGSIPDPKRRCVGLALTLQRNTRTSLVTSQSNNPRNASRIDHSCTLAHRVPRRSWRRESFMAPLLRVTQGSRSDLSSAGALTAS